MTNDPNMYQKGQQVILILIAIVGAVAAVRNVWSHGSLGRLVGAAVWFSLSQIVPFVAGCWPLASSLIFFCFIAYSSLLRGSELA